LNLGESDLLADRLDAAQATFLALLTDPRADPQVQERALYQLVVLNLTRQAWIDVRQHARQFLDRYPDSSARPYVRYALAESLLAPAQAPAADLEAARQQVEQQLAAPAPPDAGEWYPRLYVLLGETHFREKHYAEVEAAARALREKFPQSKVLYQMDELRGRAFKQQAQFEQARAALNQVLADPQAFRTETAAKSQLLIAETYFLEENWKEAFLAYQKVYASYDFPVWRAAALLQSGQCDEKLGQWRDAVNSYQQLISEFPTSEHVAEAQRRLEAAKPRAGL
jgi:outer membrane protein assembly factor BamD (BamD/ComL family)